MNAYSHIWCAWPVREHSVPPCSPRALATCVCNLPLTTFGRLWHSPCGVCLGETPSAWPVPLQSWLPPGGEEPLPRTQPRKTTRAPLFTVYICLFLVWVQQVNIVTLIMWLIIPTSKLNMSLYPSAAEYSFHVWKQIQSELLLYELLMINDLFVFFARRDICDLWKLNFRHFS